MGSLHLRECSVGDGREPIRGAEFDTFIDRMGRLGIRENGVALFSAHPMGSARAGTDPRTSAAKPTGEPHDVRNLWIGDGSLLPTAPGVNPTISIMALAARTARVIRERISRRRPPSAIFDDAERDSAAGPATLVCSPPLHR